MMLRAIDLMLTLSSKAMINLEAKGKFLSLEEERSLDLALEIT